jgi:hypothetical protein
MASARVKKELMVYMYTFSIDDAADAQAFGKVTPR